MVMLPLRAAAEVLESTVKLTVSLIVSDLFERWIQAALVEPVQEQDTPVSAMPMLPEPPSDGCTGLSLVRVMPHPVPPCCTVNGLPPMSTVADRGWALEFGSTVIFSVELPVEGVGDVTVIQDAPGVADHEQDGPVFTDTLSESPA